MKKIFSSWIFIFVLSVTVLLLILSYTIYSNETSPPSKGWSGPMNIASIDKSQVKDYSGVSVATAAIPEGHEFITLWEMDGILNYTVTDGHGKTKLKNKIDYKFPEIFELKAMDNNGTVDIYGLSNEGLIKYILNLNDNSIKTKKVIAAKVNTFILKGDTIIYSTDKLVKLLSHDGSEYIVSKVSAKILDAFQTENSLLYVLTSIENLDGTVDLNYAVFNASSKAVKLFKGVNIPIVHNYELTNSVISILNNKVSLIAGIREWETGETTCLNFEFPTGNSQKAINSKLELQGYNPNPVILEAGDGVVKFIATTENQRGFNTTNLNLGLFTIKNGKVINKDILTKTGGISTNPQIFKLGSDLYIQWEDVGGSGKKVYFESTNKQVVKAAAKIDFSKFVALIIGTMTGTLWGLSFILLLFICLLLPTLLFILLVSMIKLNWLESHMRTMLNMCIGLQLVVKILFTLGFRGSLESISAFLPSFLTNTPGVILAVIITTCISAYCVRKKYSSERSSESIIKQYMFFAIIDLVLYSLIFYPYYAF